MRTEVRWKQKHQLIYAQKRVMGKREEWSAVNHRIWLEENKQNEMIVIIETALPAELRLSSAVESYVKQ